MSNFKVWDVVVIQATSEILESPQRRSYIWYKSIIASINPNDTYSIWLRIDWKVFLFMPSELKLYNDNSFYIKLMNDESI